MASPIQAAPAAVALQAPVASDAPAAAANAPVANAPAAAPAVAAPAQRVIEINLPENALQIKVSGKPGKMTATVTSKELFNKNAKLTVKENGKVKLNKAAQRILKNAPVLAHLKTAAVTIAQEKIVAKKQLLLALAQSAAAQAVQQQASRAQRKAH